MDKTRDEIESQIEGEREALRSNLEELRDRVRSATDWRSQFRHNPVLGLSIAFGGGLLLAGLLGGRGPRAARTYYSPARTAASHPVPPASAGHEKLLGAWDAIQSALIGVVATTLTNAVGELVPGFRGHASGRSSGNGIQGEGDYEAARRYRAGAERYARTADVRRAAREAAPHSEAEADELERAEALGRSRGKPS